MKTRKTLGNRIMMMSMAVMMAVLGFSMSKSVFAGNTGNEAWGFNLSIDNPNMQYIAGRNKTDSTKIYINWNTAYGGNLSRITVAPYGAYATNGAPLAAGTSTGGERQCIMNGLGKYSLTNYVFELKYPYARPGMKAQSGAATARGVWSPDSIGTYTILQ